MKIISIINQKGGTGKTTTAVNLSSALAKLNKEVLIIDLDPQGNATSNLGAEKHTGLTIYDILINKKNINSAIESVKDIKGLDLIKANISLAKGEPELILMTAGEIKLKKALAKLNKKYDYIIIDCPPALGLLTINALSASSDVIIPIETSEFALEGISDLFNTIKTIREEINEDLNILGVLLTKYNTVTSISKLISTQLKDQMGDLIFTTIINNNVKISESQFNKKPVDKYDDKCKGSINYYDLAKEVLEREKGKN